MDARYSQSIYYNVRLTARYCKAFIVQALEKMNVDITMDEVFTLDILRCDGPMCQRDLAKQLFKDRSNTGKIAQALQEKGLISINAMQRNNRLVKLLSLTDKGKNFLENLSEKSAYYLNIVTKIISEEEYETLQSILNKIRTNLSSIVETQI